MAYTADQLMQQMAVAHMVATDAKAVRRGVTAIRLHPDDWEMCGCPSGLMVFDKMVPVEPTGTKRDWVRWFYKKGKRRMKVFR